MVPHDGAVAGVTELVRGHGCLVRNSAFCDSPISMSPPSGISMERLLSRGLEYLVACRQYLPRLVLDIDTIFCCRHHISMLGFNLE